VGARIDLLPHQMAVASEVANRLVPRVLLADEVGLGKTIEACLVVQRLLLAGRAQRVLIVVPETLIHQWFLELLRRFNLWFHIFTEARCAAIEEATPGVNPFLDDQLVLCDIALLTDRPERLEQAIPAGWDMVVVDEAHHLRWSPSESSAAYVAVERLSRVVPALLLLTATPEQLGVAGHFARLRLLDPDRYPDLERFLGEANGYRDVARLAGLLHDDQEVPPGDRETLAHLLGETEAAVSDALDRNDARARHRWFERLLDQHGTGRVMFRNTRAAVSGFPRRVAHVHHVQAAGRSDHTSLHSEWTREIGRGTQAASAPALAHDPRIAWLTSIVHGAPDKVLVICATAHAALAIEAALKQRTSLPLAAFHEGMTLIQRDRAAAWFADPDGARLLVCSEIGSEGRNFQFAHHLVLFDLPLDPALLEQRIGRLDRIGQRHDVHIHVPLVEGTHLEVLVRWYHEALGALEHHVPGAGELFDRFRSRLEDLASRRFTARQTIDGEIDLLVADVRAARAEVAARLEAGRDRLLEWSSQRPGVSASLIEEIRRQDADVELDRFMLQVLNLFFIDVDEIAPRTYRLGSAGVLLDEFPGLKADGLTVTRDRDRALLHEDLQFLTWDHPLVTGALDMLLGSERGNCGFARWVDDLSALYLESLYLLECPAPPALHVDRFLPPTPIRVVVDHRGRDAVDAVASLPAPARTSAARTALLSRADIRDTLLPTLVERSRLRAEAQVGTLVETARHAMRTQLDAETARLRELQALNGAVADDEIARLEAEQRDLDQALGRARLRLDAVRLVHRGPAR
jgi:ATP-dependent helicase HepA